MSIIRHLKSIRHNGYILVVIALMLAFPTTAIALDADISDAPIDASAVNAAVNNDSNSAKATTFAVMSSVNQIGVSDALKDKAKAKTAKKAKEKAVAETAAQNKVAEKKAAKKVTPKKTATKKAIVKKSVPANSTQPKKRSSYSATDKFGGRSVSTSFTVKAYAYTGGGTTASGMKAAVGRIAVDPRVIPLGTRLYIEGYGLCIAADTGGAIKGKTVDLYMNSESACNKWGVQNVTCYVLD
jgi:3D (Asp-Asp-Asp) domain-containing protein